MSNINRKAGKFRLKKGVLVRAAEETAINYNTLCQIIGCSRNAGFWNAEKLVSVFGGGLLMWMESPDDRQARRRRVMQHYIGGDDV